MKNITISKEILDNYCIVDVRTPGEWESGTIDNAKLIMLCDNNGIINQNFLEEFKNNVDYKNNNIAFVCATGSRSKHTALMVEDALNIECTNLDGGMAALLSQGYEVKK
ncbi:rhodanese-like domain-containing protein [Campylobacter insulaenigrae]|uniref:rhodanese-like domain-containing protein n=1 Tax=Campylobacter insulaenigrae TaxID=260714 RepID=UPI0021536C20|nr:rhodanese-like domain-containing protein [Campylobacter insulaenigrae]MCR6587074.1 rhodanese-like domain-containing protein [Campylobacter insulaenigrae]